MIDFNKIDFSAEARARNLADREKRHLDQCAQKISERLSKIREVGEYRKKHHLTEKESRFMDALERKAKETGRDGVIAGELAFLTEGQAAYLDVLHQRYVADLSAHCAEGVALSVK